MKLSNIFKRNLDYYIRGVPLIINQGGTRSGKTYSILQLLYFIAVKSKKRKVISVVSRALPHLRLGAMRDFEIILSDLGVNIDKIKNKSNNYYTIGNSIIEFFGADSTDKVHGPARDILYINEVNFIKQAIFDQLAIRTTSTIFVDFNPMSRFYIHDLMTSEQCEVVKSTYLDNEFLTIQQIRRIEAKKNNKNWWRVYGLGEIGILEDAIFTNWKYGLFDESLPFVYGLDFGVNDPDAMVRVAIDRKLKKIYADESLYQNNLTTSTLLQLISSKTILNNLIIADSSASRTIKDMKFQGINVIPVKKYAGSIVDGIRLMQDYEIIITERSFNLEKELMAYRWIDSKAGVPIDKNNHLIDATRYAVQTMINPTKRHKTKVL